jgi:Uri superfamily endonuclease
MTGAYLLILFNPKAQRIKVGKLGEIDFAKGYYFYVGSGMKNLEQRVLRHQRKNKKIKWHIDYLTQQFKFIDAKLFPSSKRLECQIAKILSENLTMIKDFGCSDCRCPSHLFYIRN